MRLLISIRMKIMISNVTKQSRKTLMSMLKKSNWEPTIRKNIPLDTYKRNNR